MLNLKFYYCEILMLSITFQLLVLVMLHLGKMHLMVKYMMWKNVKIMLVNNKVEPMQKPTNLHLGGHHVLLNQVCKLHQMLKLSYNFSKKAYHTLNTCS